LKNGVLDSSRLGLEIVAEIFSDYNGTEDTIPELGTDGIWHGSVHHLERGECVSNRPTVEKLAEILVSMASFEN